MSIYAGPEYPRFPRARCTPLVTGLTYAWVSEGVDPALRARAYGRARNAEDCAMPDLSADNKRLIETVRGCGDVVDTARRALLAEREEER